MVPNFLAPRTGFVEDSFSTDGAEPGCGQGGGGEKRKRQEAELRG